MEERTNPDEHYLLAQQQALMDHHPQHQRQRMEEDALSHAIAASLAPTDQQVAETLYQTELETADVEMALALESSQQTAQTETLRREYNAPPPPLERHPAAWDCPVCTFANTRPYISHCVACHSKPPPGVLVFTDLNANSMRFGLEIELVMEHGRRDGFTCQDIADRMTQIGPPVVVFAGYSHETTINEWKVVTDSSLQMNHPNQDVCFELVSPILQGEAGCQSLRTVMENVCKLGIGINASCGFHVHVDAEKRTSVLGKLEPLKRMAQCFVSLENAFDLLVGLSWDNDTTIRRGNGNRYCRSNRLAFGECSNAQRWQRIAAVTSRAELVHLINPDGDRYRKLNLTNITKTSRPSTVEFRHHGGVEDIQEAEAWVRLLLLFCHNAGQGVSQCCLLPETATPQDELRALFALVHCQGLEQYFVVERRLFDSNRLSNDWQCRVCRRTFRTSRSLAQHAAASRH